MRRYSRRLPICMLLAVCAQLFEPSPAPAQQPPVNQPRTVVVNVLVVSKGADGSETGFCTPVSVTAGGAEGSKVRVGFFETEAGGTGDSWRLRRLDRRHYRGATERFRSPRDARLV